MDHAPRAASSSWAYDLRQNLGGSFTARTRGLLATEFALLDPKGEEFGRLRLRGASGAELRSGDRRAALEKSGRRYRMVTEGREMLIAVLKGRSVDALEISCGGRSYQARIKFFRNLGVASYPDGAEAASLSGGLMGRSYEALFAPEDGFAFLVAIFLLWHVAANRRRAYRLGSLAKGGAA